MKCWRRHRRNQKNLQLRVVAIRIPTEILPKLGQTVVFGRKTVKYGDF